MNDYEELLGDITDCLIAHPSEKIFKTTLHRAYNSIEQLMRERDAAVADIHWLIVSWFTTEKINACKICCNYNDGNHNNECKNCHTLCPYSNFSWRGVQK